MKTCDNCGKTHNRKRFCSNTCKDRFHNRNNPRGYGLMSLNKNEGDEDPRDEWQEGWDDHKDV